jgi:hypothetical protein
MLLGSNAATEIEYSGVVDARLAHVGCGGYPIVERAYLSDKGDTIDPNRRRSQLLWQSYCHCLKQQLPGIHLGLCRILVLD